MIVLTGIGLDQSLRFEDLFVRRFVGVLKLNSIE